ncbi:hypothetical protein BOO86_11835 [Mycobacterium sp. CBMA 234]|nr:hypothetical protein [Mycolicibacterium sp. CBMA 234]
MVIEDAGANGSAGAYVHLDIDYEQYLPQPALWVHTMSMHECDLVGRLVHVKVLTGPDRDGLGELAYDGQLTVPSGIIAVGDVRDPGRQLLCGSPTTLDVSVFVDTEIHGAHFDNPMGEYPVSGPSDVNILLRGDPGFTYAAGAVVCG